MAANTACRSLCQIVDEPFIEVMVIGKETNILSHEGREQANQNKPCCKTSIDKRLFPICNSSNPD